MAKAKMAPTSAVHNTTRREAMTGAAVVAVAGLAAVPAMGADHPDAELLALWRERQHLGATWPSSADNETVNAHGWRMTDVDQQIARTPADTADGLFVKVRVLAAWNSPEFYGDILSWSLYDGILDDGRRMALAASEPMTTEEDRPHVPAATREAVRPAHPDAALFDLWRDYEAACVERERERAIGRDLEARAAQLTPPMPDEACDLAGLPRGSNGVAVNRALFDRLEAAGTWRQFDDLTYPWRVERMAIIKSLGNDEHEEAFDATLEAVDDVLDAIGTTDATTPDGLAIKLHALSLTDDGSYEGNPRLKVEWLASLARSVAAMGGRFDG